MASNLFDGFSGKLIFGGLVICLKETQPHTADEGRVLACRSVCSWLQGLIIQAPAWRRRQRGTPAVATQHIHGVGTEVVLPGDPKLDETWTGREGGL